MASQQLEGMDEQFYSPLTVDNLRLDVEQSDFIIAFAFLDPIVQDPMRRLDHQ